VEKDRQGRQQEHPSDTVVPEVSLLREVRRVREEPPKGVGARQVDAILVEGRVGEVVETVVRLIFVTLQHINSKCVYPCHQDKKYQKFIRL
jgi:hypothetical protein